MKIKWTKCDKVDRIVAHVAGLDCIMYVDRVEEIKQTGSTHITWSYCIDIYNDVMFSKINRSIGVVITASGFTSLTAAKRAAKLKLETIVLANIHLE